MARAERIQFNIRSAFARRRARELARETGMTASQVVEEALRAYAPAPQAPPGALIRKGRLLVLPAGERRISQEEADEALTAVREGEP